MPASHSVRFGGFELWPAKRRLLRDGVPCRIGGRAFDILTMLVENRHRVVSRSELLDRVWPGLAVEPNNLQVQIWALRKLLGHECIVTVERRGYHFVGSPALRGWPHAQAARDRTTAGTDPAPVLLAPGEGASDGGTARHRLRWHPRRG